MNRMADLLSPYFCSASRLQDRTIEVDKLEIVLITPKDGMSELDYTIEGSQRRVLVRQNSQSLW